MLTKNVDLKNKTILVTGAAGFIGSNLVMELLRTVTPVKIVGFDSCNDYYDVSLKDYRLAEIEKLAANYPESKWKRKLRMLFNAGFYSFGESKFTSSIEVNNKEGLQFDIKGKNIIEVPRKQLFEGLGTADKEKILSIYLSNSEKMDIMDKLQAATTTKDLNDSNSVSLLLTQPLGFDKITSYEMHEEFYKDIVEKYGEGRLIIKPHPRDDFDYKKLFPDAVVIDYPFLPVEALGFLPGININKAITWCSTSISGISFCDNKVYLGIDYITPYLKRDNFESKWHLAASLLAK